MITDDEFHAALPGIIHFLHRFDTAIEGYDQAETIFSSKINALDGDPISFAVAIGYIKIDFFMQLFQEGIYQGDSCSAIDIIIAVNHDLLTVCQRFFNTRNSFVHIFHQEGVVQVFELRSEIRLCRIIARHVPLRQQIGQLLINVENLTQMPDQILIPLRF